jgi:aromatic-amino-acid transaminase
MDATFGNLATLPADPLLSLTRLFEQDRRPSKLDLGVGVYRDDRGATPVLAAVKEAEARLLVTQATKAYLGPEGDARFSHLIARLVLGEGLRSRLDGRLAVLQTPGGTGALRLAAELLARSRPGRKIWLGTPCWPNHQPIFATAGLTVMEYAQFDLPTQTLRMDALLEALGMAEPGDAVLLQASCHNPTGLDPDARGWEAIAVLLAERGLVPLLDCAYHGFGDGLEPDAAAIRLVVERVPAALVAYSCDKNFALYRDRVGALLATTPSRSVATAVESNLLALARANYSMPPDHGAAVVRTILDSPELTEAWKRELEAMRARIAATRAGLAARGWVGAVDLTPLAGHRGMFSLLPLDPRMIEQLRVRHGIYMAGSGRINVAGLPSADIDLFVDALAAVQSREAA